jgi:thiamine biosynthesis protein ThiS
MHATGSEQQQITLLVNGEWLELSTSSGIIPLSEFLIRYGITTETTGIAVSINRQVVPKSRWAACMLSHQDAIEIVTARQGG